MKQSHFHLREGLSAAVDHRDCIHTQSIAFANKTLTILAATPKIFDKNESLFTQFSLFPQKMSLL